MPEVLKFCHAAASPQSIRARSSSRGAEASFINGHILNVDAGKNH
jgi:hypothetical protein